MANVQDINLTDSLEIDFKDGDLNIQDSDNNHINLIVQSEIGAWKEYPLCGFGIDKYIASSGKEELMKRNLFVQLQADNYKVDKLTIDKGKNNDIVYYVTAERIK